MDDMKTISLSPTECLAIPRSVAPKEVHPSHWKALGSINDEILDRVRYDYERAHHPMAGVQTPAETLQRGRGVCIDFAALFENSARKAGFSTMSVISRHLNHAWNIVFVGTRWFIIDVTWNGGESLIDGRTIPSRVRHDPDFRRRYFLTSVSQEETRVRGGLLLQTHRTSDAKMVDLEKTCEAQLIASRVSSLLTQHQNASLVLNQLMHRYRGQGVDLGFGRQVGISRGETPGSLQRQLDAARSQVNALGARIHEEYAKFQALEASAPLAIHLSLQQKDG